MTNDAGSIIRAAVRDAVRAEAEREGLFDMDDEEWRVADALADAALAAVAPFLESLRDGSSRGYNRAAGDPSKTADYVHRVKDTL